MKKRESWEQVTATMECRLDQEAVALWQGTDRFAIRIHGYVRQMNDLTWKKPEQMGVSLVSVLHHILELVCHARNSTACES